MENMEYVKVVTTVDVQRTIFLVPFVEYDKLDCTFIPDIMGLIKENRITSLLMVEYQDFWGIKYNAPNLERPKYFKQDKQDVDMRDILARFKIIMKV